jgi:hypothetical protein
MNEKKIYVEGFDDIQTLLLISVLEKYAKTKKIKTIIFNNKLSKNVLQQKIIKKFFKQNNIIYFDNLKNRFKILFFIFFSTIKVIYFFFLINRKKLLDKKISWYNSQIFHSIWDHSYLPKNVVNLPLKNKIYPSFFELLKSTLTIFVNTYYARILKSHNVSIAFMGHQVYASKAKIAEFRRLNIKVIGYAAYSFFEIPKKIDTMWSVINKKHKNYLHRKILRKKSYNYWKLRIVGKGGNQDSRLAAKYKNQFNKKKYKNILMMHIFNDSPFNFIDRKRIFSDYYHWIEETLKILCESKVTWIARPHPGAKKWGENSKFIYNKILKKVQKVTGKKPNIIYDESKISNIDLLKNADKILTFSGTSHIEAACFGIKPIIISNVTLNMLSKKFTYKPKSIYEYKKLILNKNKAKFLLPKKLIYEAREYLFIIENTLAMDKELDFKTYYRNESLNSAFMNRLFIKMAKSVNKLQNKIYLSSGYLNSKFRRTLSWRFLNLIKQK